MAAKGNVFTGARAKFSIDSTKIGYATNCSGSEEIQYDPIETLDNIQVAEHVPIGYRVTFSAGFVRIIGESLKSLGFFPKLGGGPDDHIKNVLTQGDLSCTIEARGADGTYKAFMTLQQVKVTSHNWTVNARGVVAEDVQFVAIRMIDETEI